MFNGQYFPRYRYRERAEVQRELPGIESGRERIDNISDTALRAFRVRYNDNTITKDAIFDYVYGVLHASAYRERFANDLAKELPRIPLAPDFHAFAKAGRELAELHLGYETCAEYPLECLPREGEPRPAHFRIGDRAMRFADDEKTALRVNEHVSLRGIPAAAHTYQVNGRTPLEWFIDRYRITQDKESGIVNDPNGWFDDPRESDCGDPPDRSCQRGNRPHRHGLARADAGGFPSGREGFMRTWKHPGGFGFAGLSPERVGACLCGFCLGANCCLRQSRSSVRDAALQAGCDQARPGE